MPHDSPTVKNLALWPHQRSALETCDRYFAADVPRSALVHLPTGTGKTGIMATISARRAYEAPVLIVCPSAALVDQLQSDIRSEFWKKIRADARWAPEHVWQLLPSSLDKLLKDMELAQRHERTVVIGTIQALQQIHSGADYGKLARRFGTILFDEGHREPAPAWARAVRGIGAPTVLFSATPFRNDLKLFDVDVNYIHFLSFKEAVRNHIIRGVQIQELPVARSPAEFARLAIDTRDRLVREGRFRDDDKMIIRAAEQDGVESLFVAFTKALRGRHEGVLALHNTFSPEGRPGHERRPDVPVDLRKRTERFLIHQFMLTEGIDDPTCTMLALFEPFSTERQLVQQVGRLTRHPNRIGAPAADAYVLARAGDGVQKMWERFLDFDDACVRNDGKPPIRNDGALLAGIVAVLPENEYVEGKFRKRFNPAGDNIEDDFRFPKSAVVFDLEDSFDLDGFQAEVSAALLAEDRFEQRACLMAGGSCCFHLSLRLNQSPFLEESLFQSPSLEVTIYAKHGNRLFFYDSAGLWIDEAVGLAERGKAEATPVATSRE